MTLFGLKCIPSINYNSMYNEKNKNKNKTKQKQKTNTKKLYQVWLVNVTSEIDHKPYNMIDPFQCVN